MKAAITVETSYAGIFNAGQEAQREKKPDIR